MNRPTSTPIIGEHITLRFPFSAASHVLPGCPWLLALEMPLDTAVLSFAILEDGPCIWGICPYVRTSAKASNTERRFFAVVKTGMALPAFLGTQGGEAHNWEKHGVRYIGTQQFRAASEPNKIHVSHIFEVAHRHILTATPDLK